MHTLNMPLVLFYAPQSRSLAVRVLLEELKADYQVHYLDLKKSDQLQTAYLAVNPYGKVPAVLHGDTLVSEQVALFIYLADLFPAAGLAPAMDDPRRGAYLRWIAQYGSCFEPAIMDAFLKRETGPASTTPWRDLDTQLKVLSAQLEKTPYLLGEKISAADILWGIALHWLMAFKIVPELPVLRAYVESVWRLPGVVRVEQADAVWQASQAANS
ncbi:glutathione S-transferase family protein [Undibacterium oligocarboniphilum]|uniref:Glutathione S-transferase family protein n=1 Tax=Undibacterium oligocarboniphilum TaxID=666702 RepID=A0A850QLD6_9BURK|nr:glutathione S-transferase family protein [Undibacterium oligocarboniphilum]MBC3869914.1 glutathione S-transferase family protein [Undibacterium oligocarboniphilum]NVO77530.1 glutathione S-transferase family protein [Undibacterium oligocarboniphilum]